MTNVTQAAPLLRPIITNQGMAAATQAATLGRPVKITHIGLTATGGTGAATDTTLPGAQKLAIADGKVISDTQVNVSALLPDTFPSMEIRGIAFYLEDGTMFSTYRTTQVILSHTTGQTLLVGMDFVMSNVPSESVIVESTGLDLVMGDWVPVQRKVNGKPLATDITLSYSDVGAVSATGGFYIGRFEWRRLLGTDGWPNAVNGDGNNFINRSGLSHVVGNNAVHIFGDNRENSRRMGIQAGHAAAPYASSPGILELNPFGGEVRAQGHRVYTPGNKPSPADLGAVPVTRKVNDKALSEDITLTASDVGASPSDHGHSNLVPNTRKVNEKPLSSDITLTAADVKAVPVDAAGKLTRPLMTANTATTQENPSDHGFHVFNDRFGMNMLNHKDSVGSSIDVWGVNLFTDSVTQRYVTFSAKKTEGEGKPSDYVVRARINTATGEMYLKDGTKQVYHQGFNPTAEAVGALSIQNGGVSKAAIGVNQGSITEVRLIAGTTGGMMMYDGGGVPKWFSYYEAGADQYRIAEYTNGQYVAARFVLGKGGAVSIDATANQVMTLNSSSAAGAYLLGRKGGVNDWYVGCGNNAGDVALSSYRHNNSMVIKADQTDFNKAVYIQGNKALTEGDQHLWKNRGSKSNLNDVTAVLPGYFSFNPNIPGSPESTQYGHGFAVNPGNNAASGTWSSQFAVTHNGRLWHRMGINGAATGAWNEIWTNNNKGVLPAGSGNHDVISGNWNVVGAYLLANLKPSAGSTVNPGSRVAGSNLHPAGVVQYSENRNITLPGTWQAMGAFNATNSDDQWDDRTTLFIRVA